MNTNKSNTLLRTIAIFVGILVFLLGGAGITKVAADAAIPGDALYPVKTTFEQARLSLAQDAGERAQMKIAFAAQHLEEIEALVAEGRYREIRQTVVAFETDINDALLELETVSKGDPTRASAIAAEVASALTRYAKILSDLSVSAPEAVRGEFHRALDTTQLVGGLNQANSNDNANSNDDGSNTNGNANSNDDDSNTNGNANDDNGNDDNGNDDDVNGNDDNNANDNANSNDDDSANANSNDDDGNSNANTNDDDRGSNMNTNDDDNGQDDRGGSDNSGSGSDDSGSDDRGGDNSGSGSDDSGSDDHGGDNSGSGSDDSGQDDRGGDSSGSDDKSDD